MIFERFFIYHTYYLILSKDHFCLRLLEEELEYNIQAKIPISSPNLLVSNVTEAQKLLKHGVNVLSRGFSFTKPLIVIHPTKLLKDTLTDAEIRLYTELSRAIKARKVLFHTGAELDFSELAALVAREDCVEV